MSGCKKYLSSAQKRKKKKEDLLMTSAAFQYNKITGFFSFDETDHKPISNITETDHSISN